MGIALWIVQVLLAVAFFASGGFKAFSPMADLAAHSAWVAETPAAVTRFAGISEILGAVGLVLPAATRIKPGLTPLAAIGLSTVMVLAAGLHAMRGEYVSIVINVVLLTLALFIVWGRMKAAPIEPRS